MNKNSDGAINTLTEVTTREDGGFCRTALQLKEGEIASVDVLSPSGKLMCRLNITSIEDRDWGNVDVVLFSENTPKEKRKVGTAKAWLQGKLVLAERMPQCSIIAVDIKGPNFKVVDG